MIKENKKAAYLAPSLVEYGSVRNLTGGSAGTDNDGGGTMMSATAAMGMA